MVKRAVVNVIYGDPSDHAITTENHRRYAEKLGCDYRVVKTVKPVRPPVPAMDTTYTFTHECFFKFDVAQVLNEYDQTLYLDGDIVISRACPNIFDFVPLEKYGFIDELLLMRPEHVETIKYWFVTTGWNDPWWSLNGGVLVLPKNGAEFYSFHKELDFQFASDQNMLTLSIHDKPDKFLLLDHRFNHSYMHHKEFYPGLHDAWIIHMAGMGAYQSVKERDLALTRCLETYGL